MASAHPKFNRKRGGLNRCWDRQAVKVTSALRKSLGPSAERALATVVLAVKVHVLNEGPSVNVALRITVLLENT